MWEIPKLFPYPSGKFEINRIEWKTKIYIQGHLMNYIVQNKIPITIKPLKCILDMLDQKVQPVFFLKLVGLFWVVNLCGAGGSRTRVQTRHSKAFSMRRHRSIVGKRLRSVTPKAFP